MAVFALSLFIIDPKRDFKGLLLRFSRIRFLKIKENKLIEAVHNFSFFLIQKRRNDSTIVYDFLKLM